MKKHGKNYFSAITGCVAIPDKYMRWVIQSVDENSTIVIDSKNKIRNY